MSHSNTKMYWLYVLRLEKGKYYVGVTSKTPQVRFKQHQSGFLAATWTKKYKPIELFDTKKLGYITLEDAERFENKVVRKYMNRFGYNNVRGGDLTSSDNYIKRFGGFFTAHDWEAITVVALLTAIIAALGLITYLP